MSLSNSPNLIQRPSLSSLVLAVVSLDTRGPTRLGPVSPSNYQATAPLPGQSEEENDDDLEDVD